MKVVTQDAAVALLERIGAVRYGHFIGTQDRHLDTYVDKDRPTSHPATLRELAAGIADRTIEIQADVVVSPPMGAINLGCYTAEELGTRFAYLETGKDGKLNLKRTPFIEAVAGYRVGIDEDVITTGGTTTETIRAVVAAGGNVVWLACLWNRQGLTGRDLGVPAFFPLVNRYLKSWTLEECRINGPCSRSVPINRHPGHGWEFEQQHPDYAGGYVD